MAEAERNEFQPRNYQEKLINIAIKKNTIVYLPTGTGKTFIAMCVCKELSKGFFERSYSKGGKITAFLVNTTQLVFQHSKYFRLNTPFTIGSYVGSDNVDFWRESKWNEELNKNNVLIMTTQIFYNAITKAFIDLNQVNLVIFDECHQAVDAHCMRQIMRTFQTVAEPPRVLGLTATLLNGNVKTTQVLKEVRELETTFQATVATVDEMSHIIGFATNPREIIEVYNASTLSDIDNQVTKKLEEIRSVLSQLIDEEKVSPRRNPDINLPLLYQPCSYQKYTRLLLDAEIHFKMLGPAASRVACILYILDLECDKRGCTTQRSVQVITALISVFQELKSLFERTIVKNNKQISLMTNSTPKLLKLIEILSNFKKNSDQELCAIIFVQRKNTAMFLYHILLEFINAFENLKDLRPDFMIGITANPLSATRDSLYYKKMNKRVTEKFARREVNILIASNVLEEGIDIQNCTLVVKFDTPTNYREYIQSKGRARHITSLYYMMVHEQDYNKFMQNYATFQQIETELNNYLIGKNDLRDNPTNEEVDKMYKEVEVYYTDGPNSAHTSSISSIPLLMMYCAKLPSDSYTIYEPTWYLDTKTVNDVAQYRVVVELPLASHLFIEPISGKFCSNKREAKHSAAYYACIYLHKSGELDNDLNPIVLKIDETVQHTLFSHWPSEREKHAGMTKTRRMYPKIVPECLQTPIQTQVYLHLIEIHPNFTSDAIEVGNSVFSNLYSDNLSYGIITAEQIPQICHFPIYISSGRLDINVRCNIRQIELNEADMADVKEFHYLVINDILKIDKGFLILGNINKSVVNAFLVPVLRSEGKVCMDTLRNYKEIKNQDLELTPQEKLELEVDEYTHFKKIVTPWYRNEDKDYVVIRVCTELNALSPFPNIDYQTYADYFREKYNHSTVNPTLPLLLAKPISSRLNCIKPRGVTKRKREEIYENVEIHLIPEMCVKQEFPASLFVQAKLLPTILHRAEQLLRANQLRNEIFPQQHVADWEPLELDNNLLTYSTSAFLKPPKPAFDDTETDDRLQEIDYNQMKSTLNKDFSTKMNDMEYPWAVEEEPKDIKRDLHVTLMDVQYYIKFLTTKLCPNDPPPTHEFRVKSNLALEFNNDVNYVFTDIQLLKRRTLSEQCGPELKLFYQALATAKCNDIVNLERLETLGDSFLKLTASLYVFLKFPRYTEGQATEIKSKLVSNKNLYYHALNKNIPSYLKINDFVPNTEWLPPGFCVPKLLTSLINNKELPISTLFYISIPKEERVSGEVNEPNLTNQLQEYKDSEDGECDDQNSYSSMCSYLGQHMVPDKTIADVVEALIGVCFSSLGFDGGIIFLEWLNLIPKSEQFLQLLNKVPDSPVINPNATSTQLLYLMPNKEVEEIEKILNYTFKNRAYLLQALTHSSYTTNRLTLSYQRLEFLGDALLDFLITTFIYEQYVTLNPGDLTDLRSALVNNETFAAYVVKLGLHKYIKHYNSLAAAQMMKFYLFQEKKNFLINDDVLILLDEDDLRIAENVDVPKILGDIFESLAGAIYLDSGMSLKEVWRVFHRIMWREIRDFSQNIPKNPIRLLHEQLAPIFPKIHHAKELDSGKVMVKLDFMLNGSITRVHGFGDNGKSAKKAAAKIALRLLSATNNKHT